LTCWRGDTLFQIYNSMWTKSHWCITLSNCLLGSMCYLCFLLRATCIFSYSFYCIDVFLCLIFVLTIWIDLIKSNWWKDKVGQCKEISLEMAAQCTVKSIECEGQEKVLAWKHSTTYVLKKVSQLCLDLHVFYTTFRYSWDIIDGGSNCCEFSSVCLTIENNGQVKANLKSWHIALMVLMIRLANL
jgi:hypothetical protein